MTRNKCLQIAAKLFCAHMIFAHSQAFALVVKNTFTQEFESQILQGVDENEVGFRADVLLRSNALSSDVGNFAGNRHFAEVELGYQSAASEAWQYRFETAVRANDKENILFSAPEAYIKRQWSDSSLSFGRVILDWGIIDNLWGFGKINNRKNFDFFEPGQEGLVGVHYKKASSGVRFDLFGSGIFVPELNPGQTYDEDAGSIQCDNPWCRPQSSTAPIDNGNDVPIFYTIEMPDVEDVVFRYSAGARVAFDLFSQLELEVYGIRKPENQISVMAEYYFDTDIGDRGTAMVNVTPQVYYHDVMGANMKLRVGEKITLYGAALSVTPNIFPDGVDPEIEYTGLKPKKKKEEYAGAGMFYQNERLKVGFHYVARISDYDLENDLLVEYPRWNQALNANIVAMISNRFSAGLDFKIDTLTQDRLTVFQANYGLTKTTMLSAGVNIIGSTNKTNSFWLNYENNDAVYASLKAFF